MMSLTFVINRIFMFICTLNLVVASFFLTVAIIHRRQCFNFPTLLACNTALATFLHATNNMAAIIYMNIWDEQAVPVVDSLCSVRAYLYHSTIAAVHYSFILQAVQRYCKVRGITAFNTRSRQIWLVLTQWILNFTVTLPAFVTGNMTKMISDNFCFVSLTRLDFIISMAAISYILPDITLSVIYKSLVRYVRNVSSRVGGQNQIQMRRDLTMVRRIVLLNLQLALVGLPIVTFIVVNAIRVDLLPVNTARILVMFMNSPLSVMLSILFWITPDLRMNLTNWQKRVCRFPMARTGRVQPHTSNQRF